MSKLSLSAFTHMHLQTARAMPRRVHPVLIGERADKYAKQAKRERKAIAQYYRVIRSGKIEGYSREQASIAHRYGVVVTASEARARVRDLQSVSEMAFNQ